MTVDEFFAWDGGGQQGKLELVAGKVRAMAPASDAHATIQGNIVAAIHAHLKRTKSPCRVAPEAPIIPHMRPKINARAPDVAVTCSPPSDSKVFDDPVFIVEVMSPGNENQIWETIEAIALGPSLQAILVVQSTLVEATVLTRGPDGHWPREGVVSGAGGVIRLTSLDLEIPIADVYEKTVLEGAASGTPVG